MIPGVWALVVDKKVESFLSDGGSMYWSTVNELRCRDRDGKDGCARMDGSLFTVV